MTRASPLLVTVNSTGRQAASIVRVASAIGWRVRAQLQDRKGLVAEELAELPNVELVEGELSDAKLVSSLFNGAQRAFINTTHWGNEIEIGRALADAAKAAGVEHYVYSSMPDHSSFGKGWDALPFWKPKAEVEKYVRQLEMSSTFVYCGIYNNNFTTLPYPLFRLDLQRNGSLVWEAPFPPDEPLPWLDAEHDIGPALLQIFKEGPQKWGGHRIPLTFEVASPRQICRMLSRGLDRPVKYQLGRIAFKTPVPSGYKDHLLALERTLGARELGFHQAPYFGPTMYYPSEAIELWEGNRGMEEYAREIFPFEERLNGLTWMDDDDDDAASEGVDSNADGTGGSASKEGSVVSEMKPADAETL